jgi:hypothetical protein
MTKPQVVRAFLKHARNKGFFLACHFQHRLTKEEIDAVVKSFVRRKK